MVPLTKACCCHLLMTCISDLANDLETTMLTIHGYKIDSIQPLLSNVESDYVITLNNDSIKIRKTKFACRHWFIDKSFQVYCQIN